METIRHRVETVLAKDPDVILGYLFGSAAQGKMTQLSDIDVAVLVADRVSVGEVLDRIAEALSRALGTDAIDVVGLNRAPEPLKYRVVRDGILLSSRSPRIRERFESDAVRRYLDIKPLRDFAFLAFRKKLLASF